MVTNGKNLTENLVTSKYGLLLSDIILKACKKIIISTNNHVHNHLYYQLYSSNMICPKTENV